MDNYSSTVVPAVRDKVENALLEEIAARNYVISSKKPTVISALSAVPKPNSEEICLIHDCSQPAVSHLVQQLMIMQMLSLSSINLYRMLYRFPNLLYVTYLHDVLYVCATSILFLFSQRDHNENKVYPDLYYAIPATVS